MAHLWDRLRSRLHTVQHLNSGDQPHRYSARASYNFPHFRQGEVLNIHREHTLGCCGSVSNSKSFLIVFSYLILICITQLIMTVEVETLLQKTVCAGLGSLGILLPVFLLLLSNKKLLRRIMLRSFMPWVKLYIASVESYALCSLCGWRWRAAAITPLLLSTQLTVFISDALFYTDRRPTLCLLLIFISWRTVLICCIRMNIYDKMDYSFFQFWGFQFFNSGTFVSKSLAILLFHFGQLLFYCKYKHRLFSVKTSYTVLQNKEWNKLERQKRVERRETRQNEVTETKSVLFDLEGSMDTSVKPVDK